MRSRTIIRDLTPRQESEGTVSRATAESSVLGVPSSSHTRASLRFKYQRPTAREHAHINRGGGLRCNTNARELCTSRTPTSIEEIQCARRARVTASTTRDARRGRPGNTTGRDRQHAGRCGQRAECDLLQPRRIKKRTEYESVAARTWTGTRVTTWATWRVRSPTPAPAFRNVPSATGQQPVGARQHAGGRGQRTECELPQLRSTWAISWQRSPAALAREEPVPTRRGHGPESSVTWDRHRHLIEATISSPALMPEDRPRRNVAASGPGFRPRGKLAVHVARSLKSAARRLLTPSMRASPPRVRPRGCPSWRSSPRDTRTRRSARRSSASSWTSSTAVSRSSDRSS